MDVSKVHFPVSRLQATEVPFRPLGNSASRERSYNFIKYRIKVLIIVSKCNERAYHYACVGE